MFAPSKMKSRYQISNVVNTRLFFISSCKLHSWNI